MTLSGFAVASSTVEGDPDQLPALRDVDPARRPADPLGQGLHPDEVHVDGPRQRRILAALDQAQHLVDAGARRAHGVQPQAPVKPLPLGIRDAGQGQRNLVDLPGQLHHQDVDVVVRGGGHHQLSALHARLEQHVLFRGVPADRDAVEIAAQPGQIDVLAHDHHVVSLGRKGLGQARAQSAAACNDYEHTLLT